MKFLKSLRPDTLDTWTAGRSDLLSRAWQLARGTLLDRAVYWGVAITLLVPALLSLLGAGDSFSFTGGVLTAVLVSLGFWFYAVVTSVAFGLLTLKTIGKERKKTLRYTQMSFFAAATALAIWGLAHFFPSVLSVSAPGIAAGTAVIVLLAHWSLGGGPCAGGACEVPKK